MQTSFPLNSDLELEFHSLDIVIGFQEEPYPLRQKFKH